MSSTASSRIAVFPSFTFSTTQVLKWSDRISYPNADSALSAADRGDFPCHCHETPCRAGTCPRRCRNYQVRTNLFMPTVCRFAVIGDMSPPYRGGYKSVVGAASNCTIRAKMGK